MDRPRRVFLSHTAELRRFPAARSFVDAAEAAVARAGDAVHDMASFAASDEPPAALLLDRVTSADVVVLLVGFRYGAPVHGRPESSYVEVEYEAARAAGKAVLAFLLSEDLPIPVSMISRAEHGVRQHEFRSRLTTELTVGVMRDPDQLETMLYQALTELRAPTVLAPLPDVLVSYVEVDGRWAEWIAWGLEGADYSVVRRALDAAPGQNFAAHLDRLLAAADRVLVVLSVAYLRSGSVLSEFDAAFDRADGRLAVVRVERVAFSRAPDIDLVGGTADSARERLLSGMQVARPPSRSAPPFPGATDPPNADTEPVEEPRSRPPALILAAEDDAAFAVELSDALSALRDEGVLSTVRVRALSRGQEGDASRRAREAGVVLLVVSRALLALDFGSTTLMQNLLHRHDDGRCVVIPVIYRTSAWERQTFGRLPALPAGEIPVTSWTSQDEALKSVVDGVRSATGTDAPPSGDESSERHAPSRERRQLGDVFKPAGLPTLTFVEPSDFAEFRMVLRQPGLGIVLEGPSGIGKTTLLRHAVEQDADRLGPVRVLSARKPQELDEIAALPEEHSGLVAVDDFHRLPPELQDRLADHLKRLADDDGERAKLVVVGIPDTARHLVSVGSDLATRIRIFRPGRATQELVDLMVGKGEAALNIEFQNRSDIVRASAGSLLTAQMLCWHLAMAAGVERTVDRPVTVRTGLTAARAKVTAELALKYRPTVDDFAALDGPERTVCIDLLLRLAQTPEGALRLDDVRKDHPELGGAIDGVVDDGLDARTREHLFYDPRSRRLIADDPQFVFYVRQLTREGLIEGVGKHLPVERTDVFVCYSHRDALWRDRLVVHLAPLEQRGLTDVWSDQRLMAGDLWREEIAAALDRARVAVLLVSADFLASDFIREAELPALLAAAEAGGCRIVPVLVKPSLFENTPELSCFHHDQAGGVTLSEMAPEAAERRLADVAATLLAVFV